MKFSPLPPIEQPVDDVASDTIDPTEITAPHVYDPCAHLVALSQPTGLLLGQGASEPIHNTTQLHPITPEEDRTSTV